MNTPRRTKPLDPAIVRRAPQEGQGWERDDTRTSARWEGSDCCGKNPLEMRVAYPMRNRLLGARWWVCSTCCAGLTGAGEKRARKALRGPIWRRLLTHAAR